jgi:hypothetical protein
MTTALFTGVAENVIGESIGERKASKKTLLPSDSGSIALMQAPSCSDSSCSCNSGATTVKDAPVLTKIKESLRYSFVELLGDISGWLIVGILVAGAISFAIPDEVVGDYLGGGVFSMLLMLVVGIPLYICATASTPLAAALVAKGMSPGTAFVFLLAGPATNAATITMVTKFLGKRSAAIYLSMIAVCSLAFGLLLDTIYFRLGIEASSIAGSTSEVLAPWIKTGFALLLIPFIINGIYKQRKQKKC